ncbi:MAG: flagellar basal-body rod protein FlgG [Aurantimonas endophytica]|jgi:flagellar basal-body rod protein FlgG|uniref:Flagellar basal-body rod protein FlgG n=1 Tax=Aurantimonas endophytica TaxID=1522175 RepID=A0A7W6HH09_9HYPH|nr:flagellar basal-body rod protein FlgG [Aurantimonas endophytica]MBB4005034.1 flagellar basal-body rod protein FlgG [Aurantimonas endophytica]MCO6405840.1 flagellar basal-body rod protein FlgG [Aurantimonas endophytica]
MRALAIAATGMNAQQTNVEVIANNIANINTTGYKRARAEFTDLLYQIERAQGVPARGGEGVVPEGAQLGLGTRLSAIRNIHLQGTLNQTGNRLDLALNGQGWFQVQGPNAEVMYTRDGAFNTNGDGQLVTLDGFAVEPAINVPQNTTEVIINESGQVFARVDGAADLEEIGQLTLASFANDAGLAAQGGNLFKETVASGAPIVGVPGDPGYGVVQQGYLEDSNVDPVKEISELISAQRAYEMNSKVISAADEMASIVSKGLR